MDLSGLACDAAELHPLIVIALFVAVLLEIHPFQDGNGRLSRILTTLLLLRAGYAYVPYSSLESVVEVAIIPLGPTLPPASCDLPGSGRNRRRRHRSGRATRSASLFGLAPHGVCRASDRRRPSGALLPHPFTLTRPPEGDSGGLLSAALSVASPRLAVSEHAARRSSDFPPPPQAAKATA